VPPAAVLLVLFEGHEEAGGLWLPADSPRLWRGPAPPLQQQEQQPAAVVTSGSSCGYWERLVKVSRAAQ
jgi:hypothetical protein